MHVQLVRIPRSTTSGLELAVICIHNALIIIDFPLKSSSSRSLWKCASNWLFYFSSQNHGHHIAKLDPLNLFSADLDDSMPPELTLEYHGLSANLPQHPFPPPSPPLLPAIYQQITLKRFLSSFLDEGDLDRTFSLEAMQTYIGGDQKSLSLRDVMDRLQVCHWPDRLRHTHFLTPSLSS